MGRKPYFEMKSNKYTGPGALYIEVLTEANVSIAKIILFESRVYGAHTVSKQVYTIGEEDVPNLVTSKAEILTVGPYISYA